MKRSLSLAFLCAAALPLAAQTAQQGAGDHAPDRDAGAAPAEQAAARPGMMMQGMQEHMQSMREQMARLHDAQDPEQRQRLMHEHMQSMQEHMAMMGRMTAKAGGGAPAAARCADGDTACRMGELQTQHGMMRQRLEEMQGLMEQMMQHLAERSADEESARRRR